MAVMALAVFGVMVVTAQAENQAPGPPTVSHPVKKRTVSQTARPSRAGTLPGGHFGGGHRGGRVFGTGNAAWPMHFWHGRWWGYGVGPWVRRLRRVHVGLQLIPDTQLYRPGYLCDGHASNQQERNNKGRTNT
jgi:hypothetical protein